MLETRNVFIDTEYFVKSNLNFSSRPFVTLQDLCKRDELRYILTSVVEQEVENKIETSIKDALNALQSFRKKASILSTIEDPLLTSFFNEVKYEEAYEKASLIFSQYNKDCNYEYVESDQICTEELLELYFSKLPPFGEGKKKSEFPDAISLLSLESFLGEGEKIYVISADKDLKNYCEGNQRLISVDSLEKLLDTYNQHTNVRTEKIKTYLNQAKEQVKTKVFEYISESDVYNSSTWEDAEVDSFSVISVSDFEVNVIEVNDEECQLTFEVLVEIKVEVIGPDFANGVYDREDGHVYTFGSVTREEAITLNLQCDLSLSYEFESRELQNVEFVDLYIQNVSGGIEISVEEHSEPDWY
ncbi:PIN domain-containing protein [Vibrio splendidus]